MKKLILLVFLFSGINLQAQEQVQTNLGSKSDFVYKDGDVGVGTSSPGSKLHINSSSSRAIRFTRSGANIFGYEIGGSTFGLYDFTNNQYKWRTGNGNMLLVEASGNVGVGTSDPDSKIHVNSLGSSIIRFTRSGANVFGYEIGGSTFGLYDYSSSEYKWRTGNGNVFLVETTGSVGIGTTSMGTHKLAVEGTIGAREIKVEANGWSDFVFEKDYELLTLEEVEQHINENGHLPEIPSEADVTENGINLGEMDAKLLQKIEELTLYMINMNKQVKFQNHRMKQLELENAKMRAEISELK
ncbi:MAG: hypothetical protein ABJH72_22360 [Reichenbachiella sp.]|uniref:hypothetical protein n=1 Tax=Reichenbachiella sp. TaxID=2184521 RepID=UPI003264B6F6